MNMEVSSMPLWMADQMQIQYGICDFAVQGQRLSASDAATSTFHKEF